MAADDAYAPPSINPGDEGSLAGALRSVLKKMLQDVDDCLPCQVMAVRGRTRATVKPMVMMMTTEGERVARAQVASVPILTIGGGGFLLSFPVKAGDMGWLKASDRDISLLLQNMREDVPNTARMHSFADGLFIPDAMRQWVLNAEDADRVVLQSVDGMTRIAIGDGLVKVTAQAVEIVANIVAIDAPEVFMTGNLHVDGHVIGGAAAIVLDTHTHPPDNTPPNP